MNKYTITLNEKELDLVLSALAHYKGKKRQKFMEATHKIEADAEWIEQQETQRLSDYISAKSYTDES